MRERRGPDGHALAPEIRGEDPPVGSDRHGHRAIEGTGALPLSSEAGEEAPVRAEQDPGGELPDGTGEPAAGGRVEAPSASSCIR